MNIYFCRQKPISDGGFWHILANLVNKHGLMPKKNFSEYYNSSYTSKMNDVLGSMLRQYAKAIRDLVAKGGCDEDIDNLIQDQMSNIYRVVGICLGIPSETFTWSYYDKDKAFKSIGPVTPKEFYEKHVKPFFNVDDKVCLVSDPRPTFEFGKLFTMDYINDVVGAKNCIFNNQPVELLLDLTAKSIKEGEAVLSSCELSRKYSSWRHGMHLKTSMCVPLPLTDWDAGLKYDFKLLLGVDIETTLSKADRFLYRERSMAHTMIFTGVKTNDDGEVSKLRAENSWGEDCGDKGYITMTAEFFKEFTIELVIDRKFVPKEVLEVFEQKPAVIPRWYSLASR
ncbi:bleomycin hydrolase-like [Anoplophora glabripennis]|uniref:bleomycin hydrolase-like n=1 Tax=Anoplophora glabripennis TaxID=217634 RepID=UPI000C75DA9E|nr:bleomycin hydrolase-like [Anoplophora glabripennis]